MMVIAMLLAAAALPADQHAHAAAPDSSEAAAILSAQQLADLREGRGMGYALAAERYGYPGPRHVLELSDALALTAAQKRAVEAQFAAMKAESVRVGAELIGEAAVLEKLFSSRTATPGSIGEASARFGAAEGRLRATHLRYHLATLEILSAGQVRRYRELRNVGER